MNQMVSSRPKVHYQKVDLFDLVIKLILHLVTASLLVTELR